ncbi:fumarate hydratase [Eubacterium barkeri]|nr:fumarate hydratase [Eubacterium barkeri]
MKEITVSQITNTVARLCIEANTHLTEDVLKGIGAADASEVSPNGRMILKTIRANLKLADTEALPICQDTGMAVVFITLGQDVHIVGGTLSDAIHAGVRKGYTEGYLRKSVVADPLDRRNTEDNTPAVIHYNIIPGDALTIKVMPKGFGSENTSAIKMLKPSDGKKGVMDFVLEVIEKGAPNACAPIIVGVGIGGTFEKAALMAKEALSRPLEAHHPDPEYAGMEEQLLMAANQTGIGPMGLGGLSTVLGVAINTYPTHIAGLPVAVNICCYVNRHAEAEL